MNEKWTVKTRDGFRRVVKKMERKKLRERKPVRHCTEELVGRVLILSAGDKRGRVLLRIMTRAERRAEGDDCIITGVGFFVILHLSHMYITQQPSL